MTGQDEREALVTVMGWRIPESADAWDIADAILAAGYRRSTPHVVETVEELDALPNGTIVKSSAGTVARRHSEFFGVVFGGERPFRWDLLALPATVLTPAPAPADREAVLQEVLDYTYTEEHVGMSRAEAEAYESARALVSEMMHGPRPEPADREALVEKAARALYGHHMPGDIEFWGGGLPENFKAMYRREARAALDAIEGVRHA